MTYRNRCRLRRCRRQLRWRREILASLTPWQRMLLDSALSGNRCIVAYSRRNGMHFVMRSAKELSASGYTPRTKWMDEA